MFMQSSILNNGSQRTPRKGSRILAENTPTPLQKRKVLKSIGQASQSGIRRIVPDTPTNSQSSQKPQSKTNNAKKLFNPDELFQNEDLPGFNDSNVSLNMKNRRRTLYRPSLSQSKSAVDIFKPKSISGNKENEKEPKGCDASFETLKKREQTKNKKVVRLSEVFSLMELNQSDKSSNNASNEQTENNEDDGLTLASSLTDVTNDNDLRSNRMLSATSFFNTTYDDTTRHFNPSLTLNKTNLNSIPSRSFVQTQLKLGTFKTTKNNEFKEIYRPIVLEKENKFENSQSQTKKRFNVTYTNLTKMQLKLLKRVFSEKFAQSSQFDKFMDLTTTHVIIGNKVSPETVLNSKLTLAILKNCQIITFDWIIQSSQSKEWLKECYFTPEGYQDLIDKLNELRYEQKQLELFNEFDIFISNTNCKQIVREQLSEIIIKCCGHVTSRPNRSNLIIIEEKDYDEDLLANELKCLRNKEIAVVDSKWIYNSVISIECLNIQGFLIKHTNKFKNFNSC